MSAGDEAVHAVEEQQGLTAGAAHDFEGAAGVAHAVTNEAGADEVGDAALQAFEGGVFAVGAIAADEVEARALIERGDHGGDVGGVVLQVAVEGGDEVADGGVDAGVHGGALTGVLGEGDQADGGVWLDVGEGGIGRAVIDEDEFVADAGEGGTDFSLQLGDVVLLIVERYDDREGGGGHGGLGRGARVGAGGRCSRQRF
jgi:hypothetical protein